nr:MAG TPA: hypothetical protein [Caudoviricetes sp.]
MHVLYITFNISFEGYHINLSKFLCVTNIQ